MILNAIQRSALPHPSGPLLQLQGDGVYSRDGRDVDLRLALDEPSPGVDTVEDLRSCIIFLHVDSVGILLSSPHIVDIPSDYQGCHIIWNHNQVIFSDFIHNNWHD